MFLRFGSGEKQSSAPNIFCFSAGGEIQTSLAGDNIVGAKQFLFFGGVKFKKVRRRQTFCFSAGGGIQTSLWEILKKFVGAKHSLFLGGKEIQTSFWENSKKFVGAKQESSSAPNIFCFSAGGKFKQVRRRQTFSVSRRGGNSKKFVGAKHVSAIWLG